MWLAYQTVGAILSFKVARKLGKNGPEIVLVNCGDACRNAKVFRRRSSDELVVEYYKPFGNGGLGETREKWTKEQFLERSLGSVSRFEIEIYMKRTTLQRIWKHPWIALHWLHMLSLLIYGLVLWHISCEILTHKDVSHFNKSFFLLNKFSVSRNLLKFQRTPTRNRKQHLIHQH